MGILERLTGRNRLREEHEIAIDPEEFAPLVEKLLNDLSQGFVAHDYDHTGKSNEEITGLLEYSKYQAILRKGRRYYLVRLLIQHRPEAKRDKLLQVFELKSAHDDLRIFPRHRRYGSLGENGEFRDYRDHKIHDSLFLVVPETQLKLYKLFADASEAQFDTKATKKHFETQLEIDHEVEGRVLCWLNSESKSLTF